MNQLLMIAKVIEHHLPAVFIPLDVLIMIVPIKKYPAPEVVKEKRINNVEVQVIDHDRDQDRVIVKEPVKTVTKDIITVVLVRIMKRQQIKNQVLLPKNLKEVADQDQDLQRQGDLKNDVIKN